MKKCPHCNEEIQDGAKKCRFCHERFVEKNHDIEKFEEKEITKIEHEYLRDLNNVLNSDQLEKIIEKGHKYRDCVRVFLTSNKENRQNHMIRESYPNKEELIFLFISTETKKIQIHIGGEIKKQHSDANVEKEMSAMLEIISPLVLESKYFDAIDMFYDGIDFISKKSLKNTKKSEDKVWAGIISIIIFYWVFRGTVIKPNYARIGEKIMNGQIGRALFTETELLTGLIILTIGYIFTTNKIVKRGIIITVVVTILYCINAR